MAQQIHHATVDFKVPDGVKHNLLVWRTKGVERARMTCETNVGINSKQTGVIKRLLNCVEVFEVLKVVLRRQREKVGGKSKEVAVELGVPLQNG